MPATVYEVSVTSRNRFGWSDSSRTVQFATNGEGKRALPNTFSITLRPYSNVIRRSFYLFIYFLVDQTSHSTETLEYENEDDQLSHGSTSSGNYDDELYSLYDIEDGNHMASSSPHIHIYISSLCMHLFVLIGLSLIK